MTASTRRIAKTGTYWIVHITVASSLAFALTGKVDAALAIGFLEPTVQALVFLLHERLWEGPAVSPSVRKVRWRHSPDGAPITEKHVHSSVSPTPLSRGVSSI